MAKGFTAFCLAGLIALPTLASAETYRTWEVDFSGRPPFKRTLAEVPVQDTASLQQQETRVIRKTDFAGRPPFKRRMVEVPVVDAASLETVTRPHWRKPFHRKPHHP